MSIDARDEAAFRTMRLRTLTRAGNVVQAAVALAAVAHAVTLDMSEPDTSYGVQVTPSWDTRVWVTGRTTTGYTINFSTAAPAGATVDAFTFRAG